MGANPKLPKRNGLSQGVVAALEFGDGAKPLFGNGAKPLLGLFVEAPYNEHALALPHQICIFPYQTQFLSVLQDKAGIFSFCFQTIWFN